MSQTITQQASRVIEAAQSRRNADVSLARDSWLEEITPTPALLLDRMAKSGALIPIGAGNYAVARLGQPSPDYLPWQTLVHSRLLKGGDYYLSGLTALQEHRLTDLSPKVVRAIIGYKNRTLESKEVLVGSRKVQALSSLRPELFKSSAGVEKVQLSRSETYYRSDFDRTLIDSLWRPDQFGSSETWLTAWGRASSSFDVQKLVNYASILGPAPTQRLGVILDLLGFGDEARNLVDRKRFAKRRIAQLIANRPESPESETDRYWRVSLNIPREKVDGWLLYEQ